MPIIHLETIISAELEVVFDLSRSIDLHAVSMSASKEKAVAGKVTGLIEMDEWVTWEAKHFGLRQQLTSKITGYDRPRWFRDEQVKGAFKYFIHDHHFKEIGGKKIVMTDTFKFESPFGVVGSLFNNLLLTSYMTGLLSSRNDVIKEFAETGKWKQVL